jgi:indole-3-glycerol phosphate synthase
MSDVLKAIVASSRRSADERARSKHAKEIEWEAVTRQPRPDAFRAALGAGGIRVIAECKRRSPSRGILRHDYDAATIARGYERGGAAAISVLTEPTFFDGNLDHLRTVRASVSLPILRKDFIVTEFQVLEARAAGADALLLIVAALDDEALVSLLRNARQAELAALVEVHDETELHRALDAGATIVGVNSRDLRTLEVSTETFDRLAESIPAGVVAVAESGLKTAADLQRLKALRYDAFLIGERFMTEDEPGTALSRLLAEIGVAEARSEPGESAAPAKPAEP